MSEPFACDMFAIPALERPEHYKLIRRLMSDVAQDIQETPEEFSFQFPAGEYDAVSQFIGRERLCCPFLRFTLEVTPDRGPLRLRISGPEGVKDFMQAEFHLAES